MRFADFLAAGALGLALPASVMAQEGQQPRPDIVLTSEQADRLAAMRESADAIDKFADPRAYRAAYEEIVEYALTIYPPDHPEIAILEGEIDFAYFMLGELVALPDRLIAQRDIYAAAGPAYREKYIETVNNLGVLYEALGDTEGAIAFQREAVRLWREDAPPEGSALLAQGLNNLAWAERGRGNLDTAFSISAEALAMADALLALYPEDEQIADVYATGVNNRVIYFIINGNLDAGNRLLREGIVRASDLLGANHPRVATMMLNASILLLNTGQFAAAEEMARNALTIRETAFGPESPAAAAARLNLISALMSQGRYEDALPLAEYTVARLAESQGEQAQTTLDARAKLAALYRSTGRLDEGFVEAERVLATYRATRPVGHPEITFELNRLAVGYARAGRWLEALPHLEELETVWRDTPDQFRKEFAQMLALRALVAVRTGDSDAARAYLEEAEPLLVEAWQEQVANEGAGGGIDIALDWGLGWAAITARETGDTDRSFDLAQYIGIGPSERGLLRARQREATGDPEVAARLREQQDLIERRELLLADFQSAVTGGDAAAAADLQQQIGALQTELANANGGGGLPLLVPEGATELQQRLAPDAALLFIVESDVETQLFVLTREGLVADAALESTLAIRQHVARLRDNIAMGSAAEYDAATATRLFATLFTPRISAALDGRSEIGVIARGELAKLPLSILIDQDGRFLIESYAFAYPLSFDAAGNAQPGAAPAFTTFLGVGSPDLPGATQAERSFPGEADNDTIAALGRLDFAEGELRALGEAVGAAESRILVGADATEAALRSGDIGRADFLTFATHGLMAGELTGVTEASLVLSPPLAGETGGSANDGLLTASEIAALDLSARWVVLSACNSASGDGANDEAFGGLAQAFLFAGADALLVSHWRVRDDAAAFLTVATAREAVAGTSPAQALREAQLAMMQSQEIADASHPAIWAPFVFVGN